MPPLKTLSFFVMLFVLASCGSESVEEPSKDKKEQLPEVDVSNFRSIDNDAFRISILKEMSVNRVSGDVIFSASHLPKEHHIKVSKIPVSRFKKVVGFPKDKKKQLSWFANQQQENLKNRLQSPNYGSLREISSNGQLCYLQKVRGKEFGFPKEKYFFLRYYRAKDAFVSIVCWTIKENADAFENPAQYMGMKLELK